MDPNEVIVKINSDNLLKVGHNTHGSPVHVLDSFIETVPGEIEPKHFYYFDQRGKKAMLMIEGSRRFNLNDPIDAHNWRVLKLDILLHEDLGRQLILIDPNADADREMKQAERLNTLLNTLMEHKEDGEWLAKVYRRVIGGASGLATNVLFRGLWDRAKQEPADFGKNEWVFEDEYFETQALLDLASERGIIIKDGTFFKSADGKVFADDRSKAIFKLQNDSAFRHYVQQQVAGPMTDSLPMLTPTLEMDDDLAELIEGLGTPVSAPIVNADGSVDQQAEEDRKQANLETLVDTLIEANLITESPDGSLTIPDKQLPFVNRAEIVGFLKTNDAVRIEFEELVKS